MPRRRVAFAIDKAQDALALQPPPLQRWARIAIHSIAIHLVVVDSVDAYRSAEVVVDAYRSAD
eukprot:5166064-Prymnesium_polylepis.1